MEPFDSCGRVSIEGSQKFKIKCKVWNYISPWSKGLIKALNQEKPQGILQASYQNLKKHSTNSSKKCAGNSSRDSSSLSLKNDFFIKTSKKHGVDSLKKSFL